MTRQSWTPEQVARLRRLTRRHPLKKVALRMKRSYSSVKNAVHKFDIDCGRLWTPAQLERLRAEYGKTPARQLAEGLGKPLTSVYAMARALKLTQPRPLFSDEDFKHIRELNAQGFSDSEIARQLGRDRHETTRHRKRMNLPSQQRGQWVREKLAQALRRQLDRLGLTSAAELRKQAHQQFARRFGLPEDLAPRAVLIVLELLQRGVMTRRAIYEAVGAPWKGGKGSMLCNASKTSYLGDLQRRGLVARIHRRSPGSDGRRLADLYLLTAEALDLLAAAATQTTKEETADVRE